MLFYPELRSVMAATPNYSGVFMRGSGGQYSAHYDSVYHASAEVGQLQGDTIRNIWFSHNSGSNVYSLWRGAAYGWSGAAYPFGATEWLPTHWEDHDVQPNVRGFTFDASLITPTDNEIRPVNIAVRYLVRTR